MEVYYILTNNVFFFKQEKSNICRVSEVMMTGNSRNLFFLPMDTRESL